MVSSIMASRTFVIAFALSTLPTCCRGEGDDPHDIEDVGMGSEIAQDALTPEQARGIHGKTDRNSDGKVSFEEIMQYAVDIRDRQARKDVEGIVDEMDQDKDGKISLAEVKQDNDNWGEGADEDDRDQMLGWWQLEQSKFIAADSNSDGFLDIDEVPALYYPESNKAVLRITAEATLKEKDRNNDGELTSSEFWDGDAVEGEELAISSEEQDDFRKLDSDGSGRLSLDELMPWESGHFHTHQAMKKMYEVADLDNDMHIDASEMDAARERIASLDAQYHLLEWVQHEEL